MRRSYGAGELADGRTPTDPLKLFSAWLEDAVNAGEPEPNATALATVGSAGQPHVRFVLLKDATPTGFVFFSNYESRKGRDLAEVPRASLAFWWPRLERQVRVDGGVSRVSAEVSDAYFGSRPHGSQVGAWASRQGEPVANRQELEAAFNAAAARYAGGNVPRPPYWGGYVLTPERYEFWQGREDRLHDRFEYRLEAGAWRSRRLSP
ncbi:MAG: pyridoxamine 5'-phosphate oxidase [Trueperaceae bacterium]